MKKLISFSLWGDSELYCQGALDNIEAAKIYYPDWICRFYVAEDCPALMDLVHADCEVVKMPATRGIDRREEGTWVWRKEHTGMFWRFLAISDPNVERVCFRDTDSLVGPRDKAAVDAWIESGAIAHRMHEVKEHWNAPIM